MCAHVYVYVGAYVWVCVGVCVCEHERVCVWACMCVHMCVCVFVCVCVRMHVCAWKKNVTEKKKSQPHTESASLTIDSLSESLPLCMYLCQSSGTDSYSSFSSSGPPNHLLIHRSSLNFSPLRTHSLIRPSKVAYSLADFCTGVVSSCYWIRMLIM